MKDGDRVRLNAKAVQRLTQSGRSFTREPGTVTSAKSPDQVGVQSCIVKFDSGASERVSSTYLEMAT